MKRGAPLARRTPMKPGKGFARKAPPEPVKRERTYPLPSVIPARTDVRMGGALTGARVAKDEPWRSEPYRRLVAALPCALCGRAGPSQAAHADFGKGGGLKACDSTCYPLCATRLGEPGCHDKVGAGAFFAKAERRAFELGAARRTRALLESLHPGSALVARAMWAALGAPGA